MQPEEVADTTDDSIVFTGPTIVVDSGQNGHGTTDKPAATRREATDKSSPEKDDGTHTTYEESRPHKRLRRHSHNSDGNGKRQRLIEILSDSEDNNDNDNDNDHDSDNEVIIIGSDGKEERVKTTDDFLKEDTRNSSASLKDVTCPICMDEIKACVASPCGHYFCSDCVYQALASSKVPGASKGRCPLCRKVIQYKDLVWLKFRYIPNNSPAKPDTRAPSMSHQQSASMTPMPTIGD